VGQTYARLFMAHAKLLQFKELCL